jgi:hypothetical protein
MWKWRGRWFVWTLLPPKSHWAWLAIRRVNSKTCFHMTARLLRSCKRPVAFFLLGNWLRALRTYCRESVLPIPVGVQFLVCCFDYKPVSAPGFSGRGVGVGENDRGVIVVFRHDWLPSSSRILILRRYLRNAGKVRWAFAWLGYINPNYCLCKNIFHLHWRYFAVSWCSSARCIWHWYFSLTSRATK